MGGLGLTSGALLRLIHELGSRKPGPGYDPKRIVDKLQTVSRVSPSGQDLDIPYPVIKPIAPEQKKESSFLGNLTDSVGNVLAGATLLPGAALAGFHLTDKAIGALGNSTSAPGQKQELDKQYLADRLARAKEEYRRTLLDAQLTKQLESMPKVAADLDALYDHYREGHEKQAILPLLLGAGSLVGLKGLMSGNYDPFNWSSVTDPVRRIGNVATAATLALPIAAGPLAYMWTKGRADAADPIPEPADPDKDVRQAIMLRARALAAGRGLPPINVRPKPVEIDDIPLPKRNEKTQKISSFVDQLFDHGQ